MRFSEEERRRLETLYTSGILFTSESEMLTLMSKAIDTVIKEMQADAGFIVLVSEDGKTDEIIARNMDPETETAARELSMSVVQKTISKSTPINDDAWTVISGYRKPTVSCVWVSARSSAHR